jgi:hypothetical protein
VRSAGAPPQVWGDRSNYNNDPFETAASATLPVYGAATPAVAQSHDRAFFSANGGYIVSVRR